MLRWYKAWLQDTDNGVKAEAKVRILVKGSNQWVDATEWPLARAHYTDFYLHSNGRANTLYGDGQLSTKAPAGEKPNKFVYDPANPVLFITDPSFAQIGGPDDYRAIERRDDVLAYTTSPVTSDTEVCGPIQVTLYAAKSAKDTEFTAKLTDVRENGFAERLSDGIVRGRFRNGMAQQELAQPGAVYEYKIDAWKTCQMFKVGHRIRLEISSSAFPKYSCNLNTGEVLGKNSDITTAEQKIYHDAQHGSHVTLAVIRRVKHSCHERRHQVWSDKRRAASEFRKIMDHPGIGCSTGALADLVPTAGKKSRRLGTWPLERRYLDCLENSDVFVVP